MPAFVLLTLEVDLDEARQVHTFLYRYRPAQEDDPFITATRMPISKVRSSLPRPFEIMVDAAQPVERAHPTSTWEEVRQEDL